MSENYKFDRYKIVFSGIIENSSPLLIGGGGNEETDSDILRNKKGKPFIPGTSVAGVFRYHLRKHYQEFGKDNEKKSESDLLKSYFGFADSDKGNNSRIIFSDLTLENDANIQIRDGIRINHKTGIVADQAKFDFEVIEPKAEFKFTIEISGNDKDELLKLIATLKRDLEEERIVFGAKTKHGFGKLDLKESTINFYDLKNKHDIFKWIKKEDNPFNDDLPEPYQYQYQQDSFKIEFDFVIKDSLIIRHYSKNPDDPDAVHILSAGQNIIPGTSIKGAIRARAERILNTLQITDGSELYDFLFGNSSENNGENNGKKYDGSIPSRVSVNEILIEQNIEAGIQQRIKIDRFTGGTINGALFDSMPIFAKDDNKTNQLRIEIKNPHNAEIGLLLLILKDLWTEDLPIGGERNIGRGVLKGKKALISYKDLHITIEDIGSVSDETKSKLQQYVDILNNSDFKDHLSKMRSIYYNEEAVNE